MPSSAQYVSSADLAAVWPTFLLAGVALAALILDLFLAGNKSRRVVAVAVGMVGLVSAAILTAAQYGHPDMAFGGAYIVGGFSVVFSEIALFATLVALALGLGVGRDDQVAGTTALLLWSTCGAMLMAGAGNLMMVFLGLDSTACARCPSVPLRANRA
jgi:NADH:ubiquinone oxidoreductase subunit 2 (subunit N)